MSGDLNQKLRQFVDWSKSTDKETHYSGKDLVRGKVYDVEWVNLKRILTGREAADIYQALEIHDELILTSGPLECNAFELVSLSNGKRMVPAGEAFDTGYDVNLRTSVPGIDEMERILTFSERQFPTDNYRKLFAEFLKSKENVQRARSAGMNRISPYAEGSIKST